MTTTTETIALFGATGSTGLHILKLALEQGYKVQALVRTPTKIQVSHDNLTLVQGDFDNMDAVRSVVKGANYVIICAGGNIKARPYVNIMGPFIAKLWPILEAESSIKVLLYQAGAMVLLPGQHSLPLSLKMMKFAANMFVNLSGMVADNQAVIDFMNTQEGEHKPFPVIVTLPGGLKEGDSSGKALYAAEKPGLSMITFVDLAMFTLSAIKDESLYGKYPYPSPAK